MKRFLSAAVITATCVALFSCSPAGQDSESQAKIDEKITVLTPLGNPPSIKLKDMAPRLDTLEGKTIYVVDNIYPNSDVLLTEIAAWFEREMPDTKAIYKRKNAMGGFEALDEALWAEVEEKADAVIIGLGH